VLSLPLLSRSDETAALPLVINVIARYWGEDLFDAAGQAEPVSSRGTVMIYGLKLAESRGFVSYVYRGSIRDLKKRIDQGIPPIVIMPGIQSIVQHALIVTGYNDNERRILTYVPEPDAVGAIPESKFEADWRQDDMMTIVILPADMRKVLADDKLQFLQSNRLCLEAEGLRHENNTDGALSTLHMAMEIDRDNAQVWCLLGGMYNELGDPRAPECYETALRLNPRYYLAHRGLGNYFLKRKDYSGADKSYTHAISINPLRFAPIYKNRAIARMQLGSIADAKEDLTTYLQLAPAAEDRQNIEQALAEL
jgi:tetratricopeptide (TPR) repeat protein